mmetsp:Transcript_29318/g.73755  ORF Transcript_29318/g.73755 Transcript_29318/m.73755 type:complete len:250 (-) Transcript_29318:68-817(-)
MQEEVRTRYKSNSTSSLYIKDTLSAPDIEELLRCVAIALYYHIEAGHNASHKTFFDIFSEEKFPITKGALNLVDTPAPEAIFRFLNAIFKAERLSAECGILMLAYIERIIALSGITMHASNWRRITLSALILASKVWEDQAVWNVDFQSVFPQVGVKDLAQLEKKFLYLLQYNVSLKASLYAKYYFELRSLAEQDHKQFKLKPLDKDSAHRLEARSMGAECKAKRESRHRHRSHSDAVMPERSPRVVLN